MGGNDQQLIESEVLHNCAHYFEVSVVHRIESPAVCPYSTFAHKIGWFLVSRFWFDGVSSTTIN